MRNIDTVSWTSTYGARSVALLALGACSPVGGPDLVASSDDPPQPVADLGSSHPPDANAADDPRPLHLPKLQPCDPAEPPLPTVRVASWNMGAARSSSLEAVRDQIALLDADVVLLQEVDVGTRRTGDIDQPAVLAEQLGYEHTFASALDWDGGVFGLAVLSSLPFCSATRLSLESETAYEPRIAFDVRVCAGGSELRLVDVHADFLDAPNAINLAELAALLGDVSQSPIVVAGDFNAEPDAASVVDLVARTGLRDVFASRDDGPTRRQKRIDFVLMNPMLESTVVSAQRIETDASDHTPLVVEFVP